MTFSEDAVIGPNPLHPDHLSPDERLREIAEILARGFVRLKARQSRPIAADRGESSLDLPGSKRGHGDHARIGKAR